MRTISQLQISHIINEHHNWHNKFIYIFACLTIVAKKKAISQLGQWHNALEYLQQPSVQKLPFLLWHDKLHKHYLALILPIFTVQRVIAPKKKIRSKTQKQKEEQAAT